MVARLLEETPEKQEEWKTFFLKWCSHFVERVVRLRQYVSEREASIPTGSPVPEMLSDLLVENDKLAEQLHELGSELLNSTPTEITRQWINYYSSLRTDIPKSFRNLHRRLSLIPAPWPRPELDLFVRSVLQAAGYKGSAARSKFTLLLTGEYNFSDILVAEHAYPDREYIPGTVKTGLFSGVSVPRRGALTIPAVERENPVIWPNLIHELGHYIGETDRIVEKTRSLRSVKKFQKGDSVLYAQLRGRWVPEIVADLVATDLLGVGYYANFVAFATYWTIESVRISTVTHPPVEARRQYICQRLRNLGNLSKDFEDELDKDYNMRFTLDNQDISVWHNILYSLQAPQSKTSGFDWEKELEEMAQEIVALEEYQALVSVPGGSGDIDSLQQQAEQLDRGWLITSKPVQFERKSVEDICVSLKEDKQKLVQPVNDVRDIITAASLAKLRRRTIGLTSPTDMSRSADRFKDDLLHGFCKELDTSASSPMRKRLIGLWEDIHRFDVAVTKSIEGVEIVRFYRSSKAYSKEVKQWKEY